MLGGKPKDFRVFPVRENTENIENKGDVSEKFLEIDRLRKSQGNSFPVDVRCQGGLLDLVISFFFSFHRIEALFVLTYMYMDVSKS